MTTNHVTVTRTSADRFAIASDILLSDGSLLAETNMVFLERRNELRSQNGEGIRVDALRSFKLGPRSLASLHALAVGESFTIELKTA